jgi:glutathione S-transferase
MARPLTIIGSFVSPYVRKVLACMNLKGIAYEVDPITPFFGNDEFRRLSPLCRIPVLIDGDLSISDSSVICAYLDEAYPGHPLFPGDPKDRARARWFEEFADTRLGDLFIWSLFYQKVVKPMVWGEPADDERIARAERETPAALDYLEGELPAEGFLFGDIGLADIAIASFFRNGAYAGFEVDAERWPRTAAFVERTLAHPAIADLLRFEDVQRSVEIKRRRQALLDAGAPLTATTMGDREHGPRRGVMRL